MDRAESELLQLAVQWAVQHPAESAEEAETVAAGFRDTGIPVAGPGTPVRIADGPFRWRPPTPGFGRFAAPLMEGAMRRATTKDLARLKALLER